MTVHQHLVDGRPAVRLTRRLPHSVERVWRAVSEPAELAQWFVDEARWTPAVGETFEAGGAAVLVTEVAALHVLAWTWGEEMYRFELSAHGTGCMLVFTHVFTPAFGPDWQHAAGWDAYFNRLDALLAGGFLREADAHVGMEAALAHYRQAFTRDRIPGGSNTG